MSFFFFKEGEDNLVLETGFWSTGCILILFSITYHKNILRGRVMNSPAGRVNIKCRFKVVVRRNGHEAAALSHIQIWLPGQPDAWESRVPGLPRRAECERRKAQGPVCHSSVPVTFHPMEKCQALQHRSAKGAVVCRCGNSGRRVEVGAQYQDARRRGDQVTLRSSSSPGGSADLWVK